MPPLNSKQCDECDRWCTATGGRYETSVSPPLFYCHVCWKSWEQKKAAAVVSGLNCEQCGRACIPYGGDFDESGDVPIYYCNLCWKSWKTDEAAAAAPDVISDDAFWQANVIDVDEQSGTKHSKKEADSWLARLSRYSISAMADLIPGLVSESATERPKKRVSHSAAAEVLNIIDDSEEEGEELAADVLSTSEHERCKDKSVAHIIFVIDCSGSMKIADVEDSDADVKIRRITSVLLTLQKVLESEVEQGSQNVYTLISFNDEGEAHFIARRAANALKAVSELDLTARERTEYRSGLEVACQVIDTDRQKRRPYVVLLSDGRPGDGSQMLARVQEMLGQRPTLHLHTIGFGDLTSFAHLQQLASIGNGTFTPAGLNTTSLHHAFSSVSSTITQTQLHSYTFGDGISDRRNAPGKNSQKQQQLRSVVYESPGLFDFSGSSSIALQCVSTRFTFDGKALRKFLERRGKPSAVMLRKQPYTKGGMRFVHGFRDPEVTVARRVAFQSTLESHAHLVDKGTVSRMVAKLSQYKSEEHNCYDEVSKFAHSHAVAKFYAHHFNNVIWNRRPNNAQAILVFVDVVLYECIDKKAPAECFIGELYLPGIFLKYNSNSGFVNPDAPCSDVAQAFSHFTYISTNGEMMVADLQGVYSSPKAWKAPRLLLTDPQVLSRSQRFGHGDLGIKGMRRFFRSHKCGPMCTSLGLRSVESCISELAVAPPTSALLSSRGRARAGGKAKKASRDAHAEASVCKADAVPACDDSSTAALEEPSAAAAASDYKYGVSTGRVEDVAAEPCYHSVTEGASYMRREDSASSAPSRDSERTSSSLSARFGGSRNGSCMEDTVNVRLFGPSGESLTMSIPDGANFHVALKRVVQDAWSIPLEEQQLCQEFDVSDSKDREFRVQRKMRVSKLRYTQDGVRSRFRDGRKVLDLTNEVVAGTITPLRQLEMLDIVWFDGWWRSLSNRRLYALKCACGQTGEDIWVRVRVRAVDGEFHQKNTSRNNGVTAFISESRSISPALSRASTGSR
eukprot:TRINITY_DN103403_c0_g1_i1.p1 TRINITY_DN103403_c0_g1~~TRINITY_DN103403_c0_g1_i1.p1  ORF type:complete len:1021 (+),score=109.16 TRINITY_DN103403_c0_g1_i1:71-3133(+)